ncbi:alpha/beta hydrolase family esterase [Gymnodinialimonas ulvae]|uniref:alpha/beta hydrolase family esterase n=1 Tax=Gymnodinialimonas ulvae TaxID=3126504 RepID=UPI0030AC4A04
MRLILAALLGLATTPALACGADTDCTILNGERTYRYYMPEGLDGPVGAVFHAHGYRGSAQGAMRNAALQRMADRLGMALVAMNADADDWNLAHRPREPEQAQAREFDYVRAVIEDVAGRVDLNREHLIATGFSAGGMMTWTLACGMGDTFAGFVPYSGTFWAPVPDTCTSPPSRVIHIHGLQDEVVPLQGRPIGPARQGDVMQSFQMYANHAGLPAPEQAEFPHGEACMVSMGDGPGALALCVFEGGHSYSTERVEWAIEQILDTM